MANKNIKAKNDQALLLQSIFEKWNPIAMGCHGEGGIYDCPLCEIYYNNGSCDGCPISVSTGVPQCGETPYKEFHSALISGGPPLFDSMEAEVKFLVNLLTPENKANLEKLHIEWSKKPLETTP